MTLQKLPGHMDVKLKGEQEYIWRIRVGDYRVLYTTEETIKIIEVRRIGHRRNIYE